MQQIFSDSLICTHCKGEFTLRSYETAGSLDDTMPKGIQFFKCLSGWTLWKCSLGGRSGQHLYFIRQIMSHHRTKCKHLISSKSSGGNYIKSGMVFGITKDALLRSAAIMEQNHRFG